MNRAFAIVRGFLVATVFVSLQIWFFPRWVGLAGSMRAPIYEPVRWLGVVPAFFGAILMLACVWRFGSSGEGTPAPFDPPRKLVTRGPYRWVRNPMYLGMGLFLVGEAILFAALTTALLIYGLVLVAITQAFVLLYEEPTLRRTFGADYERYCSTVPRWIPRRPHD